MKNDNTYKLYVQELGSLMKEYALESRERRDRQTDSSAKNYMNGYVMGYHRIISLMIQLAEGMLIPLEDLELNDFDPDEELV